MFKNSTEQRYVVQCINDARDAARMSSSRGDGLEKAVEILSEGIIKFNDCAALYFERSRTLCNLAKVYESSYSLFSRTTAGLNQSVKAPEAAQDALIDAQTALRLCPIDHPYKNDFETLLDSIPRIFHDSIEAFHAMEELKQTIMFDKKQIEGILHPTETAESYTFDEQNIIQDLMHEQGIIEYLKRKINNEKLNNIIKKLHGLPLKNVIEYLLDTGEIEYTNSSIISEKQYEYAIEQFNQGVYYQVGGEGVTVDYAKAVQCYEKAAELGCINAISNLAAMYYDGIGVHQDYTKAQQLFEKAAKQGNDYAQNFLGVMYVNGQGVTKNYVKAQQWFKKAIEQGARGEAYRNLGNIYFEGLGVERDYVKALNLFEKAAEKKDLEAQYAIGVIYMDGLGISKDYAKARQFFENAAKHGHSKSKEELLKLDSKFRFRQRL